MQHRQLALMTVWCTRAPQAFGRHYRPAARFGIRKHRDRPLRPDRLITQQARFRIGSPSVLRRIRAPHYASTNPTSFSPIKYPDKYSAKLRRGNGGVSYRPPFDTRARQLPKHGCASAIEAVRTRLVPTRRTFWAERCAWMAATLKEGAVEGDNSWRDLALVARDLAGQRPLDEIPLIARIAAATVEAFEERKRAAAA